MQAGGGCSQTSAQVSGLSNRQCWSRSALASCKQADWVHCHQPSTLAFTKSLLEKNISTFNWPWENILRPSCDLYLLFAAGNCLSLSSLLWDLPSPHLTIPILLHLQVHGFSLCVGPCLQVVPQKLGQKSWWWKQLGQLRYSCLLIDASQEFGVATTVVPSHNPAGSYYTTVWLQESTHKALLHCTWCTYTWWNP